MPSVPRLGLHENPTPGINLESDIQKFYDSYLDPDLDESKGSGGHFRSLLDMGRIENEAQWHQRQQRLNNTPNLSRGGMVYARNGMLIPYRPQGTDTVPAMLTPGEFVVNKTATQQHLPALQAMNQGGRVAYLNNGTPGIGAITELDSAIRPLIDRFNALSQNMSTQGVSTNSSNINVDALGTFTSTLNKLLGQLSNIGQQIPSIPSEINFNMAPIRLQVDITGAEALAALEPGLQDIAATQIQEAINTFKNNSFDIA